uniref:Myotubularin phosphatase domain-containing protein n=1 Tax=Lotharella globosa TaxID=91324 RepID=A0A7S3ZFE5_9EUKA
MNYTKEVEFEKKYEASNFCTLLKWLQTSRGSAYRIFSDVVTPGQSTLTEAQLREAVRAAGMQPLKLIPKNPVDFEEFLEMYVKTGPSVPQTPPTQTPASRRNRRRNRNRSMTSLISTEMLPGESQIVRPSNVALMLSEKLMRDGVLTLTNYRILFQENLTLESLSLPVATIKHVETKRRGKTMQDLIVTCKDYRVVVFVYDPAIPPLSMLHKSIKIYAFPEKQEKLFAFMHRQINDSKRRPQREPSPAAGGAEAKTVGDGAVARPASSGWDDYDFVRDAKRLGLLDKKNYLKLTKKNEGYAWSQTYPALMVVPGNITDGQLDKVGKFRSKARIPAVVYIHPKTKATITRCAQPMGGVTGQRCKEDETLINSLRTINPTNRKRIYLFDARPKIAALGNKAMGKGFENVAYYEKAEIEFLGIDNIHHVRGSLDMLMDLTLSQESLEISEWHQKLVQTKWLYHIRQILLGAKRIVRCVKDQGCSCVVHCSDGWDRTAQLCSLAELLLDPYYRTMKGFAVLVEKEWLSFGHNFEERIGHGHREIHDQRSPIFVQWMDCVWQIYRQQPLAFEFTEEFLIAILDHLYDCRFGTFLFNFESQRVRADLKNKTISLWSYLLSPEYQDSYKNYLYAHAELKEVTVTVSTDSRRLLLWEAYHMRYNPEYLETMMQPAVANMLHTLSNTGRAERQSVVTTRTQRVMTSTLPDHKLVSALVDQCSVSPSPASLHVDRSPDRPDTPTEPPPPPPLVVDDIDEAEFTPSAAES